MKSHLKTISKKQNLDQSGTIEDKSKKAIKGTKLTLIMKFWKLTEADVDEWNFLTNFSRVEVISSMQINHIEAGKLPEQGGSS